MIYIDPPYNTGNDSFIYPDNYKISRKAYDKEAGIRDENGNLKIRFQKNTKESGHYHSAWLSMMYPRLFLARNLLKEDGVIFISIDDNEQANLKLLCDEIFGEENFIANIVWQKKYAPANDATGISNTHDHILVYAKTRDFSRNLLPRTERMNAPYKYDDKDGRGPWRSDKLTAPTFSQNTVFSIVNPQTGKNHLPPSGKCWAFPKERLLEMVKDNRIYWGKEGKGAPQLKRYLKAVQGGRVPETLWKWEEVGHTDVAKKELIELFGGETPFDTPKPTTLIQQILKIASDKDSLVLDFFAGSGTLAHAVMALNAEDGGRRRSISIQLPEEIEEKHEADKVRYRTISEITRARIEKVIKKLSQEKGESKNLTCADFKLTNSNFKQWRQEIETQQELENQLEMLAEENTEISNPLNLLSEIVLKAGYGLLHVDALHHAEPLSDGNVLHCIKRRGEEGRLPELFICLTPYAPEILQKLRQIKYALGEDALPPRFVILDQCFEGEKADEQLANLKLELEDLGVELEIL